MKFWMGVVSKDHVQKGVNGGFCQLCHGKETPLKRMKKGDYLLYYSPKISLNGNEKYQAITAIGKIIDDNVFQFEMSENFIPFRRNIKYANITRECPIEVLRKHEEWKNYVSKLRYGHFEITKNFFEYIYNYVSAKK